MNHDLYSFTRWVMIALVGAFLSSCSHSEFSTTRRVYRDGHYVNIRKPLHESRLHAHKVPKPSQTRKTPADAETPGAAPIMLMASNSPEVIALTSGTGQILAAGELTPAFTAPEQALPKTDTVIIIRERKGVSSPGKDIVSNVQPVKRKTEPLGLWGFVSSLTGFFLFGAVILGPLGAILGSISLSKIKKDPITYKGKGFAIAAIIIGLVSAAVMLAILMSA